MLNIIAHMGISPHPSADDNDVPPPLSPDLLPEPVAFVPKISIDSIDTPSNFSVNRKLSDAESIQLTDVALNNQTSNKTNSNKPIVCKHTPLSPMLVCMACVYVYARRDICGYTQRREIYQWCLQPQINII